MSVTIVASGGNVGVAISSSSATVSTSIIFPSETYTTWDEIVTLLGRGYNYPPPTGQTTTYRTGDDADIEATIFTASVRAANSLKAQNGLADFLTLSNNNTFGNTSRFSDSEGLQDYGATGSALVDYVIDHYTGLGWNTTLGNEVWNTAIDNAISSTDSGFSDWFIADTNKKFSIAKKGETTSPFLYSPFDRGTGSALGFLTSTTNFEDTAEMHKILFRTIGGLNVSVQNKGIANYYYLCRKHF